MRTGHSKDPNTAILAAAIEAAASRLALTQSGLAVRLGISRLTLKEIESGRDCRASTLARILSALPDVLPTDALGCPGRPALGLAAAWRFDCRLHGAHARRAAREVRVMPDGGVASLWLVEGVRVREDELGDAARLADLLRLMAPGRSAVLARLPAIAHELARRRPAEPIEEAGAVHAFSLRRGPCPELRYERRDSVRVAAGEHDPKTAAGCIALGSIAVAQMPVERMVLSVELPEGSGPTEPVPLAWLGPLVPEVGEPGVAPGLRTSSARLSRAGGRHVLAITRPPVGLVVGLGWRSTAVAPQAAARTPPPGSRGRRTVSSLGAAIRSAREAEAISARELARRMGVGAMTVSDAERGRDLRASTLRALLHALPHLSPWELLAPAALSAAQAWAHRRDLFGCEVESETKLVEITGEGDARMRIETRGLRLVAARPGPLRVRLGFSLPTVVPTRARLSGVAVPGDRAGALRIAAATGIDDERLHQLTVPEKLARQGISCTRELLHRGIYSLTAERGRARHGTEGPFHEGTSFAAVLPVRQLRLVVRFPPGTWPEDFTSHAWPTSTAPDPATPGISSWLHPEGLPLEASERRREVALVVDRPIIGAKYGIGWRLR